MLESRGFHVDFPFEHTGKCFLYGVRKVLKPVSFRICLNPVSFHLYSRTIGVVRRIAAYQGVSRLLARDKARSSFHFSRIIELSCGLYQDRDSINETCVYIILQHIDFRIGIVN